MDKQESFEKLWDLIKPINVGMLVMENNDNLHAIPMHLVQEKFDGALYFFTDITTNKIFEIKSNPKVCVAFSSTELQSHVSISGEAEICQDKELIDKFWNIFVSAWFPQGKDSPSVALIKINATDAEYWDSDSFKIIQLFNYAKGLISEKKPKMGEHEKNQFLNNIQSKIAKS